jgi:hypothetical protein
LIAFDRGGGGWLSLWLSLSLHGDIGQVGELEGKIHIRSLGESGEERSLRDWLFRFLNVGS